jgi:hypothetical protein
MVWAPGLCIFGEGAGNALSWARAAHPKHRKPTAKAKAITPFSHVMLFS